MKWTPYPTVSAEQAIAMLHPGETVECRFEFVPNTGITTVTNIPRDELIKMLREVERRNFIFVSGKDGIRLGYAIHFEVTAKGGMGNLFVKTSSSN